MSTQGLFVVAMDSNVSNSFQTFFLVATEYTPHPTEMCQCKRPPRKFVDICMYYMYICIICVCMCVCVKYAHCTR